MAIRAGELHDGATLREIDIERQSTVNKGYWSAIFRVVQDCGGMTIRTWYEARILPRAVTLIDDDGVNDYAAGLALADDYRHEWDKRAGERA